MSPRWHRRIYSRRAPGCDRCREGDLVSEATDGCGTKPPLARGGGDVSARKDIVRDAALFGWLLRDAGRAGHRVGSKAVDRRLAHTG